MRIVRGNQATVASVFTDAAGETPAASVVGAAAEVLGWGGTVSLGSVADMEGGSVTASGGTVSAVLPLALTAEVDNLTVRFTGTVGGVAVQQDETLKVRSARYFPLSRLREQSGIDSGSQHDVELLEVYREAVEDFYDDWSDWPYVGGYAVIEQLGWGKIVLPLATRRVVRARVLGASTDLDVSGWVLSPGRVLVDTPGYTATAANPYVLLGVETGTHGVPGYLANALVAFARDRLLKLNTLESGRARIQQTDFGMTILATASPDYPSGIPEVDVDLKRAKNNRPKRVA